LQTTYGKIRFNLIYDTIYSGINFHANPPPPFFFIYSNMGKRENGKITKGSFLILNLIEEMKGETVGMLPNTRWKTTHPATRCASRLAHLDIYMFVNFVTILSVSH